MAGNPNPLLLEPISHETQSRPFSFHHTIVPPECDLALYQHWHNEIEFFYLEQGELSLSIEEQQYQIKAGEAILIPPNHIHMATTLDKSTCEYFAFVFTPSYFFEASTGPNYFKYIQPLLHSGWRFSIHLKPAISWQNNSLQYLRSLFDLITNDLDQWELQIHGILFIIWQLLYNNHLSKIQIPNSISRNLNQLEASIRYIHDSYDTEIVLSDLATLSNLSEGQFCRLFKKLTGFTPFNYINRYRILKSCEYLSESTKKVAEIASLCGFNNISYYNRVFMSIIKVTPSAYRKTIGTTT